MTAGGCGIKSKGSDLRNRPDQTPLVLQQKQRGPIQLSECLFKGVDQPFHIS